ncbi:hypothetical protein HDU86_007780 [Geranomyces michiganensis]|nr:hypothetical protein HDU86_007780 [Geranomyces michiganensis]
MSSPARSHKPASNPSNPTRNSSESASLEGPPAIALSPFNVTIAGDNPPRARVGRTYVRQPLATNGPDEAAALSEQGPRAQPSRIDDNLGEMDKGLMRLLDLPEDAFATRSSESAAPAAVMYTSSDDDDGDSDDHNEEDEAGWQDQRSALSRAAESVGEWPTVSRRSHNASPTRPTQGARAANPNGAAGMRYDDSDDEDDVIVLGSRKKLRRILSQDKSGQARSEITASRKPGSNPTIKSVTEALSPVRRPTRLSCAEESSESAMLGDRPLSLLGATVSSSDDDDDDDDGFVLGARKSVHKNALSIKTGGGKPTNLSQSFRHSPAVEPLVSESAPAGITSAEILSNLFGGLSDSDSEDDATSAIPSVLKSGSKPLSDYSEVRPAEPRVDAGAIDSDDNDLNEPPPPTLGQRVKALSKKEKLELKKETERLLRSSVIEAPKRQSKFTVDKFLAARGMKRNSVFPSQPAGSGPSVAPTSESDVQEPSETPEANPADTSAQLAQQTFPSGSLKGPVSAPPALRVSAGQPAKPMQLKADKVISRSDLRAIVESNAAISREGIERRDLYDGGNSSDDDVLEIFEVREEIRQPTGKEAWNQQLIRKNIEQARERRKEEEEAMRLAAQERERRKEEKRAQRQAQKEVDAKLALESAAAQDGGVVNLDDDTVMVGSPSPLSPQEMAAPIGNLGKMDENNVASSPVPPMRRLFSEDRTPFEEIFRREEVDENGTMMTSEKVRGGGSDMSSSSEDEDVAFPLSSPPTHINLKYSLSLEDIGDTQETPDSMTVHDADINDESGGGTSATSSNATAQKPKSRVQMMKGKDAAAPIFASIFNKRPDAKPVQAQGPIEGIENDDELIGMLSGNFDSTGPTTTRKMTGDEHPRFASIFGSSVDKAAATAVPGAEDILAEMDGSGERFQAGDDLLGMSSKKFDGSAATAAAASPRAAFAELSADEDDPFAAILSDDSSDEDSQAAKGEKAKRARRFVGSDDEDDGHEWAAPRPRLPVVVRTIPPRVVQEGDDDDMESVASSQITDEEIPDTQDTNEAAATNMKQLGLREDAEHNRSLSVLLAQPPPQERNVYVETEAFEEEDEFFGLGGADGEKDADQDAALDQDLHDLVVSDDSEVEGLNDVLELHRKQAQEAHEKGITALLNDVTTGNLRKRKARQSRNGGSGAGFMDDSDEDDDLLLAKIRGRHLARGKDGAAEEEDTPGLNAMASNPETQAFAKCFENACEVKEGFLSSDEDVIASAPMVLRTYDRRKGSSDQAAHEDDVLETGRSKQGTLHRLRSWPTDKPTLQNESSDDNSQNIDIHSPAADEDLLMEVDRQGIDALKLMQERRRVSAGGPGGEQSSSRDTTLSRSLDSTRIFRKRSFLENSSNSSSATSPRKKKSRQLSTGSGSGFGSEKSGDGLGVTGRRGMGFKIGGAPPLPPPAYASFPSSNGELPSSNRSAKAKKKAAEQDAAATKLRAFLSRQTSFR